MIRDQNLEVYESADVVQTYLHHQQLTKAERTLFGRFDSDYRGKAVLDIGVGAGRTTPALAALAAEYLGIDYSQAMVQACQDRFAQLPVARFLRDDARELSQCPDAHFDAAVFSFNGIDTIDMAGRQAVLKAVHRVLKPGGVFVFSFHNAHYLDELYQYHWQKNPLRWWPNYQRRQRLRLVNGGKEQYAGKDYFFLKDGGEDFRLDICYIRPGYQQQMLAEAGFRVEQSIESLSGVALDVTSSERSRACWIYYRCVRC